MNQDHFNDFVRTLGNTPRNGKGIRISTECRTRGFLRPGHSLLGAVVGALSDLVHVLIELDVESSNHNPLLLGQLNRPSMRLQQKYFEGSTNR